MKYLLVVKKELDVYLRENGFTPIYSNSEKSIYEKSEELHMKVNGWHSKTNYHGKYSGHYDINTPRELEIELMLMGYCKDTP